MSIAAAITFHSAFTVLGPGNILQVDNPVALQKSAFCWPKGRSSLRYGSFARPSSDNKHNAPQGVWRGVAYHLRLLSSKKTTGFAVEHKESML